MNLVVQIATKYAEQIGATELVELFEPSNRALPYVWDELSYDHCAMHEPCTEENKC